MLVVSTQHQHSSGMVSHHHGAVMLVAVSTMYHCCAFHHYHERPPRSVRLPIIAASRDSIQSNKPTLDPDIAAQFTIQVCTSTSCTRKLDKARLDQFHVLGEIYAQAQSVNLEKCMIIEDGGCQGGKNCKMGEFHGAMGNIFLARNLIFFDTHLDVLLSIRTMCCYFA